MTDLADQLVGAQLGPCRILGKVGAGAMGIVFRARHDAHGEVCVKVIGPEFRAAGEMLRRFRREAEAACRIDHRHVVRGFGLLEADGHQLLVQELVAGGDLGELLDLRGGRLPIGDALRVTREVALGLGAAHAAGIVHRDLKPGNVLLDRDGRVKVADLGLILQVDGEPLDGRTILTTKGQVIGTPLYMAPEQWKEAHDVDGRADLYALGVMLHQLVSGRRPFESKSIPTLMKEHIRDAPPPVRTHAPNAPKPVEELILRLLAKDPDERPADAAAVAAECERIGDALGIGATVRGEGELDGTVIATVPRSDPGDATATYDGPPPTSDSAADSAAGSASGSASDLGAGTVIGSKFRVEDELGRGGMGVVFRARHTLLGQDFAVKLIHARLAGEPEFRARFLREAKALMAFTHKGAVSLRDFGEHEGGLYMAMDLAPGEPLSAVLERDGSLPQTRVLELARQVLACLDEAHETGLVHRDLKPDNLLVERRADGAERVRILDFGIAKLLDERAAATGKLTSTGVSLGTPHYMSPEQDAGDPVDGRSDIYSFAAVLYEAVSGRRPIEAETIRKLRYRIQMEPPPPLAPRAEGRVSEPFAAAIMAALAKEPDERPATAQAFLEALEEGARTAPPRVADPEATAAARPHGAPDPRGRSARRDSSEEATFRLDEPPPTTRRRKRRRRDADDLTEAGAADSTIDSNRAAASPFDDDGPRSVVKLIFGLSLLVSGLAAFGCCGCFGGVFLWGGSMKAETAAKLATARVVSVDEAPAASGLVCVEAVAPVVDDPVRIPGTDVDCIFWSKSVREPLDSKDDDDDFGSTSHFEDRRAPVLRVGDLVVRPAAASFRSLAVLHRENDGPIETTYSGIRTGRKITIIGEVRGGEITDGDPFIVSTDDSLEGMRADAASTARVTSLIGTIGVALGPILIIAGVIVILRR